MTAPRSYTISKTGRNKWQLSRDPHTDELAQTPIILGHFKTRKAALLVGRLIVGWRCTVSTVWA